LKRWKSLRDRFVREAKKVKENATPDGGSGYVPPWSLFHSMTFLMDSIRHRKSSMLTLKRDASELALPEDSTEIEASGDGEFLPLGSPGDSSVDLSVSPASKRRKTSHLPVPPLVVSSASTPLDPRLNKSGKEGGGSSMQTSHQVTQAILKSLKALEETVQEQQRVIVDEDELFGKQVAMVMQRLNSRQKAVAKLRIQQVFLDIEFPPETPDIS
jgi:Adh transcription factor 1